MFPLRSAIARHQGSIDGPARPVIQRIDNWGHDFLSTGGNPSDPAPALNAAQAPAPHFALSGPRRPIDPATNAVRPDLADIRLAEYVFAPHYAAPMTMIATAPAPLRSGPGEDAPMIASLTPGDRFEALEISRGYVWGKASGPNLVGYVAQSSLTLAGDAG